MVCVPTGVAGFQSAPYLVTPCSVMLKRIGRAARSKMSEGGIMPVTPEILVSQITMRLLAFLLGEPLLRTESSRYSLGFISDDGPCDNRAGPPPAESLEQAMPDLPSGTVTFLFTDIEGSTALWERDRVAMASAVERHIALLDAAIATQDRLFQKQ